MKPTVRQPVTVSTVFDTFYYIRILWSNCKGLQVEIYWVKISPLVRKLRSTCKGPQVYGSRIRNVRQPVKVHRLRETHFPAGPKSVRQPVKVYRLRQKLEKIAMWSEKCPSTIHIMEGWGLDRQPVDVCQVEPQILLRFNLSNVYRLTDSFSTLHIATGEPKCYQICVDSRSNKHDTRAGVAELVLGMLVLRAVYYHLFYFILLLSYFILFYFVVILFYFILFFFYFFLFYFILFYFLNYFISLYLFSSRLPSKSFIH